MGKKAAKAERQIKRLEYDNAYLETHVEILKTKLEAEKVARQKEREQLQKRDEERTREIQLRQNECAELKDILTRREQALEQTQSRANDLNAHMEAMKTKLEAKEESTEIERKRRQNVEEELKHLRPRIENLESVNERLTLLLSNEQALRMKALPARKGFFKRLFSRSSRSERE